MFSFRHCPPPPPISGNLYIFFGRQKWIYIVYFLIRARSSPPPSFGQCPKENIFFLWRCSLIWPILCSSHIGLQCSEYRRSSHKTWCSFFHFHIAFAKVCFANAQCSMSRLDLGLPGCLVSCLSPCPKYMVGKSTLSSGVVFFVSIFASFFLN